MIKKLFAISIGVLLAAVSFFGILGLMVAGAVLLGVGMVALFDFIVR